MKKLNKQELIDYLQTIHFGRETDNEPCVKLTEKGATEFFKHLALDIGNEVTIHKKFYFFGKLLFLIIHKINDFNLKDDYYEEVG